MKHVAFDGRLVMLGFGSIGQGVLPLILRHIDMPARAHRHRHRRRARRRRSPPRYGVSFSVTPLTRDNLSRMC